MKNMSNVQIIAFCHISIIEATAAWANQLLNNDNDLDASDLCCYGYDMNWSAIHTKFRLVRVGNSILMKDERESLSMRKKQAISLNGCKFDLSYVIFYLISSHIMCNELHEQTTSQSS